MTIDEFIKLAIAEDVGDGDHSSLACINENQAGKAELLVKENGIIAGVELAEQIFKTVDSSLQIDVFLIDGTSVSKGEIAFTVSGAERSILLAERLVLNCMQRMSGIATLTNQMVSKLVGLNTTILDTRKTSPLLRFMEKWAVRIGGGTNHRMGLYDMIMLKDNHIDYAGGISIAIAKTQEYLRNTEKTLCIEIEVRTLSELDEVLQAGGVNRIMLDNFSYTELELAVNRIDGKYETEASGGITMDTIREYAECGVDYISVGALTHSVKSLDLSLKAVK